MSRKTVKLSGNLDIGKMEEILYAGMEIITCKEELSIDLSEVTFIRPIALTVLASTIYQVRTFGTKLTVVLPTPKDTLSYINSIGFQNFLEGKQKEPSDYRSYVPLYHLNANKPQFVDLLINFIQREGIDDKTSYIIRLGINELIQNVFDHAKSQVGCFMCSQSYRQKKYIRTAMVDLGVGIPANARTISRFKNSADDQILLAATNGEITTRHNIPGAKGLKMLCEIITENRGNICIFSHKGRFTADVDKRIAKVKEVFFHGTGIEFKLPYLLSDAQSVGFGFKEIIEGEL
ncbi:MAG: hypothetical protein AB1349_11225 [Elusimicrobiota bacterium]